MEQQTSNQAPNTLQNPTTQTEEIQKLAFLKQAIASTLTSVQEIENQMIQKSNGISEEARQALLNDVQHKINETKQTIQKSFEQHTNTIHQSLDQLLHRVEELKTIKVTNDGVIDHGDQASGQSVQKPKRKFFAQKTFVERSSLLSFENGGGQGFRTLESIFIAFLILIGIYICMEEYFERGTFFPDLDLFFWVFSKFHVVLATLFLMYGLAFMIVPFVQFIHHHKVGGCVYIPAYFVTQCILYVIGVGSCYMNQLPPASAIIVTCEMARVSMKMHSYLREKVLNCIMKNSEIALFIPEWAKKLGTKVEDIDQPLITIESVTKEYMRFAYFFLSPTLVYRDNYVKSRRMRTNKIVNSALTFVILIFYLWSVFKALCIPIFKHTANNPGGLREFIASVIFSTVSGIIVMLTLFYGILHTWFNLWGEILRFGDRQFYEDWWNVKDFEGYYRKWNIVVHEFLYFYVFQDAVRFSKGKLSRQQAKYLVFFISAIIHEVVVTCGLGFFFPILFLMFGGPGVILTRIKFNNGPYTGTFFWFLMLIGSGLLMVLICREFYARQSPEAATFEKDGFLASLYPQSIRFMIEKTN